MQIGFIGLPRSGKTTVFDALTRGAVHTEGYSSPTKPNIGVVKVPDTRLDALSEIFKPKKTVPAEAIYIDVAAPAEEFGKQKSARGQFLSHLSNTDALVHVVRAFRNDSVPHIEKTIDAERDINIMNLELVISDLAVVENRLSRLQKSLKSAKAHDREHVGREQALLNRIKASLENDIPLRDQVFTPQEQKDISNFQFLTAKPMLLLINIGEEQLPEAAAIELQWRNRYPKLTVTVLCAQIEMELAQLTDTEAGDFRANLGLHESNLARMIGLSYELLGLITFFTTGSDEVRAWNTRSDSTVHKAAGKIHTDLERGFIRAEVISYDDMIKCGTIAEARKYGLLRVEGKRYKVKDGDNVTVLFNI